jgi:hypothetical protein
MCSGTLLLAEDVALYLLPVAGGASHGRCFEGSVAVLPWKGDDAAMG